MFWIWIIEISNSWITNKKHHVHQYGINHKGKLCLQISVFNAAIKALLRAKWKMIRNWKDLTVALTLKTISPKFFRFIRSLGMFPQLCLVDQTYSSIFKILNCLPDTGPRKTVNAYTFSTTISKSVNWFFLSRKPSTRFFRKPSIAHNRQYLKF